MNSIIETEKNINSNNLFSFLDITDEYKRIFKIHKLKYKSNIDTTIHRILKIFNLKFIKNEYDEIFLEETEFKKIVKILENNAKIFSKSIETVGFQEMKEMSKHLILGAEKRIDFNEAFFTSVYFNQSLNEPSKKRRDSWIDFMNNHLAPIGIFGNGVVFDKREVEEFYSKIGTRMGLMTILNERLKDIKGLELTRDHVSNVLNKSRYTDYFESRRIKALGTCPIYYYLDDEFLDKLEEILRERLGRKYKETRDYYTLNEFSKIMNSCTRIIKRYIEEGIIIATKKPFADYYEYMIPVSEKDRLMDFKATHTSFKDIVDKMYNETLERGLIEPKGYKRYRDRVRMFVEKSDYFECDFIHSQYTIFSKDFGFFINNNDLKTFEENLEIYEMDYEFNRMTLDEREKKSFDMINPNLKKTLSDLREFYDYRVSSLKRSAPNAYLSVIRGLGNILDKELYQLNDDEILNLVSIISREFPERSKREFLIQFIEYTKENNICTFTKEFAFNYKAKTHIDVSPYTEEQMFKMAILVFNETHPTYKTRLEKSLENRRWLSIWLYTALHYVCGWRTIDLIVNLPRITLPTETYQELFRLVKDNKFTKEMACRVCDELTRTIEYLDIKPHKTSDKAIHPLIMDIPEGAKETIGLLLCLSEAHLQKIEFESGKISDEKYITNYVRNDWAYEYVFGNEFIEIFEKSLFSNRRANKYYLDSIAKKVDEDKPGTGYIIASLARAHNFTIDKLSNTTDVYLRYFKDIATMDILTMTLFERGVCSFVPYLALKMIEGENQVRELTLEKQTEKINNLPSPINIELMISNQSKVLQTAKEDVSELISFYMNNNSKKIKEDVYKFVSKIAKGTAPCKKYNNIYCMSVAKGLGCTEPDKDCIGCGQEIYLKSAMHILGDISISLAKNYEIAKTEASKKKYKLIIKNVIKPIISNLITCLGEIYNVSDVSEFKKIYSNSY